MDLIVILAVVLANLLLGLLVLKSRLKLMNIIFFAMTLAISSWSLCNYFAEVTTGQLQIALTQATYASAIAIAAFFFLFAVLFPKGQSRNFGLISIVSLIMAGLGIATCFTPMFVTGVSIVGTSINIQTGPLFTIFLILFPLAIIAALSVLIYKYRNAKGQVKTQIQYVFLGTFFVALFASISNIIIPFFTGNYVSSRYGPLSTVFFIGFTAYAIVKHRMMDIRMVVARSVSYALLLFSLAGLYAGAVLGLERLFFPSEINNFNIAQGAMRTMIAVVMVFLFQPLRTWITKVTDKIFFKNTYDAETFLDTMSHTIGSAIVLIELLYKTLNLITSQMKVSRGIVVVLTDSGKIYTSQSMGYPAAPKINDEDMKKLVKDGIVVYDELEETSHYKHLLKKYNASIVVPLKTDADTEGVLILGEKLSGDMYSAGDLKVFEIIAPELAVAVANAKSFEKIEKFNVTLREEVKKATSELEKKNTQLMELDKAKDEFISMASHQLRTPLTAIKGYLSMLLEGDAGEIKVSQYDFVNEAYQGANRMVGLINDLLNVSRMETGRFFLEPVEIDLDKLVQEEVKQLVQHAKEKHLVLKYEEKGKTPKIWADETKLRQVVMNFIDNAVYYTNEGNVTVKLSHDAKNVIFEVKDSGIGVPKAQQKQLFAKFFRADNARHVRPDGTGLGIYLAKRVLDDHHAELIFRSKEGEGSTFGFRFPIKSKLSTKRVNAPTPGSEVCTPAIGELAAGVGVSPKVLEATSAAGIEKPLSDSTDAGALSKEAVKLSQAASGSSGSSMPDDIVKSAEAAIKTMNEIDVKKEEVSTK
jgi:signal transduction histidine kinase